MILKNKAQTGEDLHDEQTSALEVDVNKQYAYCETCDEMVEVQRPDHSILKAHDLFENGCCPKCGGTTYDLLLMQS